MSSYPPLVIAVCLIVGSAMFLLGHAIGYVAGRMTRRRPPARRWVQQRTWQ